MSLWTKTTRGWVLRDADTREATPTVLKINAKRTVNDREVSQGRNVKVSGTNGQRRVSVCVSDFIEYIDLRSAVGDIRRKEYLFDVIMLLMTKSLSRVSGAAHRQLFRLLEAIVNEAVESHMYINRTKILLTETMKTLTGEQIQVGRVGSNSLWNKHIQTVANLCTKMDQYRLPERNDDGLLHFTDLPKECIREIMLKLSDHRDIIHLGQTCWDMHYISEDSSIWEKLVQYHFNDKQIDTFIESTDCLSSTSLWQNLHQKCFKRYGLKQHYVDQLVICSACKTLHWMMIGHQCWVTDKQTLTDAWLEPMCPDELHSMLFNIHCGYSFERFTGIA